MIPDTLTSRLAAELGFAPHSVAATVALLDDGNTVPFITRYRKEATGGLDETQLRALEERLAYLRGLEARRAEVRGAIEAGGNLSEALSRQIDAAATLQQLEDLYLPFRPKRRTRAQAARELGLQGLADLLWAQQFRGSAEQAAAPFVDVARGVADVDAALAGARDIVAELVAETAEVRQTLREAIRRTGRVRATRDEAVADEGGKFQLYYQFDEPLSALPPHRILAINRGEREGVLRVAIEANHEAQIAAIQRRSVRASGWLGDTLRAAIADGYKRLLQPAIERDLRTELTDRAEEHALVVFAANLRGLLLQAPLRGRRVLGVDPGFRSGCKLAAVDATSKLREGGVIYLHQPDRFRAQLREWIARHQIDIIAIGNGTASRETETLVAEVIRETPVRYVIVSEAGASVYSASEIAREEFPELDATQRGNVSIARRLQDPLAELVKIDPKALGVGLYQHDVDQKRLGQQLGTVVESCVNFVGVDLNTASAALLGYVAGLSARTARSVVAHRDEHGPFVARRALLKVKGLGPKAFEQAAGFLRIPDAAEPLDTTAVHPESYAAARALAVRFGADAAFPEIARRARAAIDSGEVSAVALASELGIGAPTLSDIVDALARPGRDPRDDAPPPILRADVLKIEDLAPGMELKGTVRNVVDFGAFVDIGVKHDGLVHVSELSARRIRHPLDVVSVGDVVDVRVLTVDSARGRIGLSMR